jgi:CO/xanthine dehydrogenase Mo-binding subunit
VAILHLTRRDLLPASGALVVVFGLAPQRSVFGAAPALEPETLTIDEVDAFLAMDGDGLVTVYAGRIDADAGARLVLSRIVAGELGIEFERVSLVEGRTAFMPEEETGATLSIESGAVQLRRAATRMREALLSEAADRLGAEIAALRVADGTIAAADGRAVAYGALVTGRHLALKLDPEPASRTI